MIERNEHFAASYVIVQIRGSKPTKRGPPLGDARHIQVIATLQVKGAGRRPCRAD